MKVPRIGTVVREEFEAYSFELRSHVETCSSDPSIRAAALQLYRKLYPIFMFLRQFDTADLQLDPTRELLLSQMQKNGDKAGFADVLGLPKLPLRMRSELGEAIRGVAFTPYLSELWSDSLMCLNSFATCNYRGANISLRCMIEDLYRHLYYKDHPEEFGAQRFDPEAEDNFGISPAEFRDYLPRTTYLRFLKNLNTNFQLKSNGAESDIFTENSDLYARCSTYVHGSKLGEMNAFRANSNAIRNGGKESEFLQTISRFARMCIAFLVAAHADEFRRFNEYDKSIALMALSREEQHGLRLALNI